MMMARPRILIAEPRDFGAETIALLKRHADVEVRECKQEDVPHALENFDVFWFRLSFRIDEKLLKSIRNRRCHILATPVTGIDHIDEEACRKLGLKIISLRGETDFLKNVRATAELTVGLAIGLMRHVASAEASVREGKWNRDIFRGNELFEKTAGIVGFGRLGKIVADYFAAFGMNILVFDPHLTSAGQRFETVKSLEELVSRADVVSLHVSYNSSTHHLVNKTVLEAFSPEGYLINTSRGGVIDELALLNALREKKLKGAALDVLQGEPDISPNHPLILYASRHSNLLIVPHIGGNTYESFRKTEEFIARKVLTALTEE